MTAGGSTGVAAKPLTRSMRRAGNLLITISAITPAASLRCQPATGSGITGRYAGLAQLVEQRFCKAKVAGSNPAAGANSRH